MSLYTRNQRCYIMSVPSGYVKIGITDNIDRRLVEVQSQFYETVEFVCATMLNPKSPVAGYRMEQLIHTKLAEFGGPRREWFKIDIVHAMTVWVAAFRFLVMPVHHRKMSEELCSYIPGRFKGYKT